MSDWTVSEVSRMPLGQHGVGFEMTDGNTVVSFICDNEANAQTAWDAIGVVLAITRTISSRHIG
jgi:hypothetical protein